jgi:hypothetical protein
MGLGAPASCAAPREVLLPRHGEQLQLPVRVVLTLGALFQGGSLEPVVAHGAGQSVPGMVRTLPR